MRRGKDAAQRVLVPLEVLETPPDPSATTQMVGEARLVLLGYEAVPPQTPLAQMRDRFEQEARERLDSCARAYEQAGADVKTRLVFTLDPAESIAQASNEEICSSVLLPRPSSQMERLLVPIRGEVNLDRLVKVTARMIEDRGVEATLLHVVEEEEQAGEGERMLEQAVGALEEAGVPSDRIAATVEPAGDVFGLIVDAARAHDGVVMGETEPSVFDVVFAEAHEQVADAYGGPILIVRRELEGQAPSGVEEET